MKNKSLISIVLALVLSLSVLTPAVAAVIGDVDGDTAVTPSDARFVLRHAVGLEDFTEAQKAIADLDHDGEVTPADARLVLRLAVGLSIDESAPAEKPKPSKPEKPDAKTLRFNKALYEKAHSFNEYTASQLLSSNAPVEFVYRAIGDWCYYYTLHDVTRPVLKELGYTDSQIEKLAPSRIDPEKVQKALKSGVNLNIPTALIGLNLIDTYVPSLGADYYLTHPQYAETFTFMTYYDDIIEDRTYVRSENADSYYPKVGDIIFMSNKSRTYVNGLPTIDHTAQIIEVYEDGTFLCTEGAIKLNEPDGLPRVRERVYFYDTVRGTYLYKNNYICQTLVIARLNLDIPA